MSHDVLAAGGCHLFSGCGFPSPSINDFFFTPFFKVAGVGFDKPGLLLLLCTVLVLVFFWLAFRKPRLVPHTMQNLGEMGVLFVRDQIVYPQLGKKNGDKWLPFLVAMFFFIWFNNIMGIVPILYFPAMAKYGFPVALAGMVWLIYMFLGFKKQGFGYLRTLLIPSGSPWWILWLLVPIELFSNVFVRPFTLSVRLFANMMAGHVLLLVFSLATWYLLSLSIGILYSATSFIVLILVTGLEVLVQALQAFIFTILTATYISGAYESAH